MTVTACGQMGDAPIHRIALRGGDLDVAILTFGATIAQLAVHGPRGPQRAVLGFDSCDDYVARRVYMGCIAGRFANRIAHGRFSLGGTAYQLGCNDGGVHHLHGGDEGFSRRIWSIEAATDTSVDLVLVSPAGDQGYPGTLTARCRYSIEGERCLRLALSATTDAPTIVNLAGHSYFNLDGEGTIFGHRLQIPAERYLPVDEKLIPTGEFRPVVATPYDFRQLRTLEPPQGGERLVFDHTYVFGLAPFDAPRKAARVEAARSGLAMEVWSTEPGVQFYDGGAMRESRGYGGRLYGPYAGLCLEPQRFPDSPNQPDFTDASLKPSQTYRQTTEYRFEVG